LRSFRWNEVLDKISRISLRLREREDYNYEIKKFNALQPNTYII